jgi:acyl-CoA dehydrogenase/citronellyl-CoA dehydrogenase
VNWELDDEHEQFRSVCRRFVDRHVRPVVDDAEAAGHPPDTLLKEMGAAGLLGLLAPAEYGGTGGDCLSVIMLAEELARASGGIAITALVSAYMAGPHIARFGNAQQQARWLPGMTSGESIVAIAITEPGTGSDVAGIATTAIARDGGYLLNGQKMFITNSGIGDIIIVAAKTEPSERHAGITTFLVEPTAPGLTLSAPLRKLGWHASDTRELSFDDCWVPADAVLGKVGRGFQQIMGAFELERVALAAMGVGHAAECLDMARSYVASRTAFGAPLTSLQVVRHKIAVMTAKLEIARLYTYQSAARLDTGHPDAARSAAITKYGVPQVTSQIVDDALQLFGGSGFMEENPVARHYRDMRVLRIGGGTDEIQLEILSKDFMP